MAVGSGLSTICYLPSTKTGGRLMKIVDIRKLSTAELATESTKLREEITELKRRLHMGEVQNVRVIREKRKDLARMLTVLSEQLTKETAV